MSEQQMKLVVECSEVHLNHLKSAAQANDEESFRAILSDLMDFLEAAQER